jgi:hypothetical protein
MKLVGIRRKLLAMLLVTLLAVGMMPMAASAATIPAPSEITLEVTDARSGVITWSTDLPNTISINDPATGLTDTMWDNGWSVEFSDGEAVWTVDAFHRVKLSDGYNSAADITQVLHAEVEEFDLTPKDPENPEAGPTGYLGAESRGTVSSLEVDPGADTITWRFELPSNATLDLNDVTHFSTRILPPDWSNEVRFTYVPSGSGWDAIEDENLWSSLYDLKYDDGVDVEFHANGGTTGDIPDDFYHNRLILIIHNRHRQATFSADPKTIQAKSILRFYASPDYSSLDHRFV